jgi:hypothetical protein
MAYLLKARKAGPEKQPLLANGSERTFVSSQRLGKHILAATDAHEIMNVFLVTIFCTPSVQLKQE